MKQLLAFFLFSSCVGLSGTELYAQEESMISAKEYYFQLEDFVKPKVYLYENSKYPEQGLYFRIYSIPDSNFLVTDAYMLDFEQVESFKEKYDSTGARVVEYINIRSSDSVLTRINESEVYRWNSNEKYMYSIRELTSGLTRGFDKTRQYQAVNQMEIMGKDVEVLRFEDMYTFYHGFVTRVRQQAFYAKEYGLVRYVRFNESTKESETYLLSEIYSEEEWLKLQE